MAVLLLIALCVYVLVCKLLMCLHVSTCVYMCLHVFWYQHFDHLFTCIPIIPIHVLVEFHTCIDGRHTVWFLPTVCCLFFADAIFCTLCSVSYMFIYVYIKVPISFNDLLSIRSGTVAW